MNHKSDRILFVHLLNDFSGSPIVLKQVIQSCIEQGYRCEILTGNKGGPLDDLPVERFTSYGYRHRANRLLTLVEYLHIQIRFFFHVLFHADRTACVYINTILPFGAALATKFRCSQLVYHVHECRNAVRPWLLKRFLRLVIQLCADKVIFVSSFAMEEEKFRNIEQVVVPNAVTREFEAKAAEAKKNRVREHGHFTVLLVCSLKAYKGVFEFVKLASACEDKQRMRFRLQTSASPEETIAFLAGVRLPGNLEIMPHADGDVLADVYAGSSCLLNMSRPEAWVETFGLTIIEAMACGLPVIAPPVGGPTEIVREGVDGYLIQCRETEKIKDRLVAMMEDSELYKKLSRNALERAAAFSAEKFRDNIVHALAV